MVDCLLAPTLDGGPFRYLWLDALGHMVSGEGGIVTVSVAEETAVNAEGRRGRVHGRGRQRGRCVPAVIPALAVRTQSGRCGADDLRRTSVPDGCDCVGVRPRQLAEMSDTLHDQPAHPGARGLQPWVVRGGGCAPCTSSRHRQSRTWSLRVSSIGRVTGSPMSPRCWTNPKSTCRCGPPTPGSGRTERSGGGPTWRASSPAGRRYAGSSGPYWPGSKTSGRSSRVEARFTLERPGATGGVTDPPGGRLRDITGMTHCCTSFRDRLKVNLQPIERFLKHVL